MNDVADALRELVELKALKDSLVALRKATTEEWQSYSQRLNDYERRQPLAWDAARAALAAHLRERPANPELAPIVWCSCGDQIVPDDGALCGACAQEELRAASADALRYRWLRMFGNPVFQGRIWPFEDRAALDAAIDAMLANKEPRS